MRGRLKPTPRCVMSDRVLRSHQRAEEKQDKKPTPMYQEKDNQTIATRAAIPRNQSSREQDGELKVISDRGQLQRDLHTKDGSNLTEHTQSHSQIIRGPGHRRHHRSSHLFHHQKTPKTGTTATTRNPDYQPHKQLTRNAHETKGSSATTTTQTSFRHSSSHRLSQDWGEGACRDPTSTKPTLSSTTMRDTLDQLRELYQAGKKRTKKKEEEASDHYVPRG